MTTLRHEFYETDERLCISIFDRNADPEKVTIKFEPRRLTYQHEDKVLLLEPLKGQIDTETSDYSIGKVKVEIRLVKRVAGRWGILLGDTPDVLATPSAFASTSSEPQSRPKPQKNWDGITDNILKSDKEKSLEEDPNVGGDSTLNSFFQKLYGDADEDTKRAMMKSYSESGGTTLSTNWDEVKRAPVDVKPPTGSEWKKWN